MSRLLSSMHACLPPPQMQMQEGGGNRALEGEASARRLPSEPSMFLEAPPKIPMPLSANLDVLDVGRVLVQVHSARIRPPVIIMLHANAGVF